MPKKSSSLITWLVLVLALIHSVHGKAVNSKKFKENSIRQPSEDCPTSQTPKFPDSVWVKLPTLRTNLSNTQPQDVRNRSLSPWDYRINEDLNRFPPWISVANCRYNVCIDDKGDLHHGMNSVPIQQEILVLRYKKRGCQPIYWLEKQMVTVGCTCAFPATFPATNHKKNGQNYRDLTRNNYGRKR